MANLTDDDKRKVEEILLEAKGLYAAILLTKPPASLGLAIRDAKPWDKLLEADITALFSVIVQLRKAALASLAAAENGAATEPTPAPEAAPKPATPPAEPRKKATAETSAGAPKTAT